MKNLVIQDTQTIRKKVYDYVREQILSGRIAPNERLIETRIAAEIGTSRTPVREALHSLELEGLIESIPRVGYIVKSISEEDVEEICEIRSLIEELATRRAIGREHEKLVAELKKNISLSEEKYYEGTLDSFVELDAQFHEIITRLSGSKRLLELAQMLRRHMLRYRIGSFESTEIVLEAIKGHKKIVKAIEEADLNEVSTAINYHMERSKKAVLKVVFREGTEGAK